MSDQHRPLMLLLVRLLGIFFIIEGFAGLVGSAVELWQHVRIVQEYSGSFTGSYALGWVIGSGVTFGAGLLLLFKSRIAMDALYYEGLDKPEAETGR